MRFSTSVIALAIILVTPVFVFAQSDGSAPADPRPADTGAAQEPTPVPADSTAAASTPATTAAPDSAVQPAAPTPTPTPTGSSAATSGTAPTRPTQTTTPTPAPVTTQNSGPVGTVPIPTVNLGGTPVAANADTDTGTSTLTWVLIGIVVFGLALMPFGYLPAGFLRRKPKVDEESDKRCFDIKQIMEDKLKELTDVKAMLTEKAKEKGKEMIRESVEGTKTGDLLVRAQKLEEQYKKLKKLYEECQIDIDRYKLKGVLVENSLLDKKILEHLRIVRTRKEGERVLHDIRLSKKQIDDIQKDIIDNKWFFHLWEPGKDDVTVVFKDKLFSAKHSDKSTWKEAIAYGVQNGIPESQMNFAIEQ